MLVVTVEMRDGSLNEVDATESGMMIHLVTPVSAGARDMDGQIVPEWRREQVDAASRQVGPTVALLSPRVQVAAHLVARVLTRPWAWGLAGDAWANDFAPTICARLSDGTPITRHCTGESKVGREYEVRGNRYPTLRAAVLAHDSL